MPTCSFCDQDISTNDKHGINYDCDLKAHSTQELYNAASAAHNLRIRNYVKTFHTKILETVGAGRFSVSFDFDCDPEDDRLKLLTTVIDRLKAKFQDILITRDSTGHEFEVCWSQPSFSGALLDKDSINCKMRDIMRTKCTSKKFGTPECLNEASAAHEGKSKKAIPQEIKNQVWEKYIGSTMEK